MGPGQAGNGSAQQNPVNDQPVSDQPLNELVIQTRWAPRDDHIPGEGATTAWLAIHAAGHCATRIQDQDATNQDATNQDPTTRDEILVSTLPLAQWFAGNLWRLRWEPRPDRPSTDWRMSHNLAAAGYGYTWPSIEFFPEAQGIRVNVKAHPPYLTGFTAMVSTESFEREIDRLVNATLERLEGTPTHKELQALWNEIMREQNDPRLIDQRQQEAILGYDPGEAPQDGRQPLPSNRQTNAHK